MWNLSLGKSRNQASKRGPRVLVPSASLRIKADSRTLHVMIPLTAHTVHVQVFSGREGSV